MMAISRTVLVLIIVVAFNVPARAADDDKAKAAAAPPAAAAAQGQPAPEDDPDLDIDPLQPDFTLVALPTTLRMPRMKSSFRVTHRFTRSLGQGDFGSLLEDFFGIDSGAAIGLEYRFGIIRGAHVGFRRTNDRTIEFSTEYSVLQQRNAKPVSLSAYASIDGTNNFRDSYTPALGVVVSRTLGPVGTVYVDPIWVNNSNPLPSELVDHNDSFLLGVGTRLRVRPSLYLVAEIIPRVAGDDTGVNQASFGFEKLIGGHVFQINFSNGFGTTTGQIARGGTSNDDWYLGFNISRKFF
jgi:hypothetical protein